MAGSGSGRVVVVGAGIQGLFAAHELGRRGVTDVTIVEALGGAGRASSGRSASMLMTSRESRLKILLSLFAYERFMRFEEEFGERLRARQVGFLSLVPPHLVDRYRAEHALRLAMGVASVEVTVGEIAAACPALTLDGIELGILGPDDTEINVGQVIAALVRSARERGMRLCLDEAARQLEVRGGRIVGVRTSLADGTRRRLAADAVVVSAGAGAVDLCRTVGLDLPIESRARSLYTFEVPGGDFVGPMVEDAEHEWYLRDLGRGQVLVGMGKEASTPVSDEVNEALLADVRAIARRRAPRLAGAPVSAGSTGLRPLTPDGLPIVGPVEGCDGLVLSCGWGGDGVMHAPAGATMVADWILGGDTPALPARDLLVSRFA